MNVRIRPFEEADYPAVAALHNGCWPDHPTTPEALQRAEHLPGGKPVRRWLAQEDGESGGVLGYGRFVEGAAEGGTFWLEVGVAPERQGRGVGRRLYEHLTRELSAHAPHAPRELKAQLREDHPLALGFAQRRGFAETHRLYHQHLSLPDFDPRPFDGLRGRLESQGYEFTTLAELRAQNLPDWPDWEQRLLELHNQVSADIPRTSGFVPASLERFRAQILENPLRLAEATFFAARGGAFVGLASTRLRPGGHWHHGTTGVLAEHRGRGLATALKLEVIRLAKRRGVAQIHTNNAATNAPILAVNQKLGFVREPAQLELLKRLE